MADRLTTDLTTTGRLLLARAGLDLDVFDTEIKKTHKEES